MDAVLAVAVSKPCQSGHCKPKGIRIWLLYKMILRNRGRNVAETISRAVGSYCYRPTTERPDSIFGQFRQMGRRVKGQFVITGHSYLV